MMPGNHSTRCNWNNGKKRSVRENPVLQEREMLTVVTAVMTMRRRKRRM
jgi:hypothetical protein